VTHDESPGARDAGERAGTSEAEDQERIAQLMRRRSKLSPDEAALLGKVFHQTVAPHREHIWNLLQKQGVESHEVEDLLQEVLLALHNFILENGFVDSVPGMLHTIAERKGLNHVRDRDASLVVSPGDLTPVRDQTPHLATVGANSSARSGAPLLQALAQLSETMLVLAGEGAMGHARAVHEVTGRLLTSSSEPPDVRSPRLGAASR
jgi:hypothetical protein